LRCREVEVNYLAANKYIQAHYGKQSPLNPYFRRWATDSFSDISSISSSSRVLELIYDAQKGIYDDNLESYQTASLPLCGFLLRNSPSKCSDWSNINQIKHVYLRELEAYIYLIFADRQPRHVAFWNPMLRVEDYTIQCNTITSTMSTLNVASMARIDTGVRAFNLLKVVIGTVENNCVTATIGGTNNYSRKDIVDLISDGHCFAIVNFWWNIDPRPVGSAPLAILYKSIYLCCHCQQQGKDRFDVPPDPNHSL